MLYALVVRGQVPYDEYGDVRTLVCGCLAESDQGIILLYLLPCVAIALQPRPCILFEPYLLILFDHDWRTCESAVFG